ncbi:putative death-receptor fusion protein [Elsinoe fawcettii]|nr:putative death-receptor fusion protein [Elsinoe fawcettii]
MSAGFDEASVMLPEQPGRLIPDDADQGDPPNRSRDVQILSEQEIRGLAYGGGSLVSDAISNPETSEIAHLLSSLLVTTNAPSITHVHRAAACNLLSAVLLRLNKDSKTTSHDLLWGETRAWTQAAQIFFNRYGDSKPKPMKQLLNALISSLKDSRNDASSQPTQVWMIAELSSIIGLSRHHPNPKAYIQALIATFEKQLFSPAQLVDVLAPKAVDLTIEADVLQFFYRRLLPLAGLDDLGPSLASLITATLKVIGPLSDPLTLSAPWVEPLVQTYSGDRVLQETYKHYVLPAFIGRNLSNLLLILAKLPAGQWTANQAQQSELSSVATAAVANDSTSYQTDQDEENLENTLIVACLLVGISTGIVFTKDCNDTTIDHAQGVVHIPTSTIGTMMQHSDKTLRAGALQMLLSGTTTTTMLSATTMSILSRELPNMFADIDAGFRSDLFGMVQRLVDRLRSSSCTLSKQQSPHLSLHTAFLHRLTKFLATELRPSASYQRHICALQSLRMLARSGIDPIVKKKYWSKSALSQLSFCYKQRLLNDSARQYLVGLLLDPFDDVRDLAMTVLRMSLDVAEEEQYLAEVSTIKDDLARLLLTAEIKAARSGRADHADGVARIYALIFSIAAPSSPSATSREWWSSQTAILSHLFSRCHSMLKSLHSNLSEAIITLPFHAILIGLRYIIEEAAPLAQEAHLLSLTDKDIRSIVDSTWKCVRPVLCNDAPEGYMPAEVEEADLDLDTKDILSFSWRALKEACLLQRSFVLTITKEKQAQLQVADSTKYHINLCFAQLRDLRHRGAFSTVAQTFGACCLQLMACFPQEEPFLGELYSQTISSIKNTSTINTRRSAGLPAMLAGLLASVPAESDLFSTAMTQLSDLAADQALPAELDYRSLPQVHALNCLREVFKYSKLAQRSEPFISDALRLSGDCLTSDLWGIRNSGLMLFRALLDRLLGTNDAYDEIGTTAISKEIFTKHQQMLPLLYKLLEANVHDLSESTAVEKVFPALQILQRASPPKDESRRIRAALIKLTSCPHWLIRDKAARTIALLHGEGNITAVISTLFVEQPESPNARHGQFLCIKYLLRNAELDDRDSEDLIVNILSRLCHDTQLLEQPETVQATALDLVREYLSRAKSAESKTTFLKSIEGLRPTTQILKLRNKGAERPQRHPAMLLNSDAALVTFDEHSLLFVESLVSEIASVDTNACITLLDSLKTHVQRPETSADEVGRSFLAAWDLLAAHTETDDLIRIAAMNLVLACSNHPCFATGVGLDVICEQWPVLALHSNASPLASDKVLVVSAMLADLEVQHGPASISDKLSRVKTALEQILIASHEDQPFDTRYAAATALSKFRGSLQIMESSTVYAHAVTRLAILTYDLTNDDDEDIRVVAAEVAGRTLLGPGAVVSPVKVPLAAGSHLLIRLRERYSGHPELCSVTLARLIKTRQVSEILDAHMSEGTALFAEEKQNLYIDLAREARIWSRLAMKLPMTTLDRGSTNGLLKWTTDGIEALITASASYPGGPLGWSYKPDPFALGLQVIYNAGVLLHWQRQERYLKLQSDLFRQQLIRLLQIAREKDLHPMWLGQLEKTLIADLLAGVQRVGQLLSCVTAGKM